MSDAAVTTRWLCSNCGEVIAAERQPGKCPNCDHNTIVSAEGATLCANTLPGNKGALRCSRPAVDPAAGLVMCENCGNAYISGF